MSVFLFYEMNPGLHRNMPRDTFLARSPPLFAVRSYHFGKTALHRD